MPGFSLKLSAIFGMLIVDTIAIKARAASLCQESGSGPLATIEFIDQTNNPMAVHLHGGSEQCTARVKVGVVKAKSSCTIAVAAGKNHVFTVGVDADGTALAFWAVPKPLVLSCTSSEWIRAWGEAGPFCKP